jgi:hypothetical protein
MRTYARNRFVCARCVHGYFLLHPPQDRASATAVKCLEHLLEQADDLARRQMQARFEAEAAREQMREQVGPLKERLGQLVRLGRAVALRENEPRLRLTVSLGKTREARFPEAARAALASATAHLELLLEQGLPAEMLEELNDELNYYLAARDRRARALSTDRSATTEFTLLAHKAQAIMRHLDALFRIRHADEPDRLIEWQAALSGRAGRMAG